MVIGVMRIDIIVDKRVGWRKSRASRNTSQPKGQVEKEKSVRDRENWLEGTGSVVSQKVCHYSLL